MTITTKEIAKLAGVSRTTVDRALKNKPGIHPKTKQKILEIATNNNYTPNTIGKALVYNKKRIKIEIILNSTSYLFFEQIIEGIKKAEEDYKDFGIDINIHKLPIYDTEIQLNLINSLNNFDALILTPINDKSISAKINQLIAEGKKVVAINNNINNSNHNAYIGCDYKKSGETASGLANLLVPKNSKICIVMGSVLMLGHNERVEGFKSKTNLKIASPILECNDDNDIAYNIVKAFLLNNSGIKLVYAIAGGINGIVNAVQDVNKEIKVICHDDTKNIKELFSANKILATITQQPFIQGYNSIKAIYEMIINNKDYTNENFYTDIAIKIKENL